MSRWSMARWYGDGRPTPNGWAAIGAAAVVCAAALFFRLVDPAPGGTAVDGIAGSTASAAAAAPNGVPTAAPTGAAGPDPDGSGVVPTTEARRTVTEPWYRIGLPVDGAIRSVGARTTGHASVVRGPDGSVRVELTGFTTSQQQADLRVQLTGGDVLTRRGSSVWVPDGDPVEVGTIAHGATTATILVATPQILPREVHSLVVLDWNTSTILGAAELLPST